jgi:hypothetical protein
MVTKVTLYLHEKQTNCMNENAKKTGVLPLIRGEKRYFEKTGKLDSSPSAAAFLPLRRTATIGDKV